MLEIVQGQKSDKSSKYLIHFESVLRELPRYKTTRRSLILFFFKSREKILLYNLTAD